MSEVVLVRHAETEWSLAHKHTGRTDVPLTDKGRQAAAALAPRLAGRRFAIVLSSPLGRATETARLAGLDPELEPDLLEWDYGAYEGITTPEVRETRPDWWLWTDGVPEGEAPGDVAARCDRVIERVIRALDGGGVDGEADACLIAHGHVLRVLAARWLEQPPELGSRLWLETGSISTLGWERTVRVLRHWNG
jgi:broad specificity phosphatase PhoE